MSTKAAQKRAQEAWRRRQKEKGLVSVRLDLPPELHSRYKARAEALEVPLHVVLRTAVVLGAPKER